MGFVNCWQVLLRDPKHLWSPHGLRSLSASDLFYSQPNAPGDAPYWRGAIWVNINFLALRALKYYSTKPQATVELQERTGNLYTELRTNLLETILGEWKRTGSLWEHYNDATGRGMRSHPFTGWTALVLNIMAEQYSF